MYNETCKGHHKDDILEAKKNILDEKTYKKLSVFYKAFGDITRLKVMSLLLEKELCVCDIAIAMDMSQPAISHQIRVLKDANIIKGRRDGKMIYYSLNDIHVEQIFKTGKEHIQHL